ncbi:MAG TPA: biotin carboxylase N-terminal domain-containing protein [Streptosporangiaceae bacterium]|nr:biotin carboxylase N-terminal domain-containing protein [Streptosporangiaceae bacterium]
MPIRKLLIANRGESAARVMRTAHAMGISTVAVFADPDAGAPFVSLADEAVRLPGAAPRDTYLRGDLIIAAAQVTGADAVHPGYGFLSENAAFARDCGRAGLVFVGPGPDAIEAMGAKPAAKALMASAGVPVLPGVVVPGAADTADAGLASDHDLAAAAERIGFPLLVKAAHGGGGRGMRLARSAAGLADAVAGARREAAAAFGDGTVFLERFIEDPRHVEVQILGDSHGGVTHLFERECSIQRRYQKIIEEAPSPAVGEQLRAELGAAAVTAAKAIGYVNAGTVEFVLDGSGSFWFLEVNTRLQVEHPVTELVTGLDLVELQLRIAEGEPLPAEAVGARLHGHAIEARLYAEDVPAGFLPATGTLHRFAIPAGEGVRIDAGYTGGSVVGPHYDAMLAKVIAHGRTRPEALRRLSRALSRAQVHGVTTNRDLLTGILAEPEFAAGHTDTGYLSRHDPVLLTRAGLAGAGQPGTGALAVAAALARQAGHRAAAPVLRSLPAGWRNVPSAPQQVSYTSGDERWDVAYRWRGSDARGGDSRGSDARGGAWPGGDLEVTVNGEPLGSSVRATATPDAVDLTVDQLRRVYHVHQVRSGPRTVAYVDGPGSSAALTEVPRFADPDAVADTGSLRAPMPGTVVRVLAEAGAPVSAGQPLIVLEAMKMEHTITAPADGILTGLQAGAGEQVAAGQVLAVVGP